jgi:hypothetical protein
MDLKIEVRAGFNRFGDLVSHEGIEWPFAKDGFEPLDVSKIDIAAFDAIREFREAMTRRGARVLVLPPPVAQTYFQQNQTAIRYLLGEFRRHTGLPVADAGNYVFPDALFFDYVCHLATAGKRLRTQKVIDELTSVLRRAAQPAATPAITLTKTSS